MKFEHNNISPLDSRYAEKIVPIREAFSEKALIKTRFIIEINWLLFLCNKMPNDFPKLSKISINKILKFRESFSDKDVIRGIRYICPACQSTEEDYDVSNSKYSAWSELDILKEV